MGRSSVKLTIDKVENITRCHCPVLLSCGIHCVRMGMISICLISLFQDPAARRRAALEESLRWHEFNFEVDAEMQWIKEHMALATSTVSFLGLS